MFTAFLSTLVLFFMIIFFYFYFSKRVSEEVFNGSGVTFLSSSLETCRLVWDKPCSGEKESLSRPMGRAALVCLADLIAETHGALASPFASWAFAHKKGWR